MTGMPKNNVNISASELVDGEIVSQFYAFEHVLKILNTTLVHLDAESKQTDISLPYFAELETDVWQDKPKELNLYLTDKAEAQQLNLDARGKDYATNILSYPSDLPPFILEEMPTIPLGELVVCHEVVAQQANEQNKTVGDHVTHLIVHGTLHLLGFDHELGQAEQDEMEAFEVAILAKLGIDNPYVAR